MHRARVGLVRTAGVRGRDLGPLPGGRRPGVRPRRQRGRRRARRARDHRADAVDAGGAVGRHRRQRYRDSYFDRYPGIWRQGDWIRFTERGSCVLTGRSDATLNRGGVRLGHGRVLRGGRGAAGDHRRAGGPPRGSSGGAGELLLFVVPATESTSTRSSRADRDGAARPALAAARPRRDRGRAGDPAHADRQEARGAGQADPPRRARGDGGQPRLARRSRRRSIRSSRWRRGGRTARQGSITMTACSRGQRGPKRESNTDSSPREPERWRVRGGTTAGLAWAEILAETHLAFEVHPTPRTPPSSAARSPDARSAI